MVGNEVQRVGMNEHACSSSPKPARKIPVMIWEEMTIEDMRDGMTDKTTFPEDGLFKWADSVPYIVKKQEVK